MKVDSREDKAIEILKEQKEEFEIKSLEIADFIVGNYAIERKHYNDELASIMDGRNQQFLRLLNAKKQNHDLIPILLIEGFTELWDKRKLVISNFANLIKMGISIVSTNNIYESIEFVKHLRGDIKDIDIYGKKMKAPPFENILRGVPKIGRKQATELIEKHKSFWNLLEYLKSTVLLDSNEKRIKDYFDSASGKESFVKKERENVYAIIPKHLNSVAARKDKSIVEKTFSNKEEAKAYAKAHNKKAITFKI